MLGRLALALCVIVEMAGNSACALFFKFALILLRRRLRDVCERPARAVRQNALQRAPESGTRIIILSCEKVM